MTSSPGRTAASPDSPLESTARLLERVRHGDGGARDRLLARYLPVLRRWARGRLPVHARDLADTDDLVQVTLMRAMGRLDAFEVRREGAFLAYLRTILRNAVLEEVRRSSRRPAAEGFDDELRDPSTEGREAGLDVLRGYEQALDRLPDLQKEAVILRLELGFSYPEVADALESPSPDAARMVVKRGLAKLAEIWSDAPG